MALLVAYVGIIITIFKSLMNKVANEHEASLKTMLWAISNEQ